MTRHHPDSLSLMEYSAGNLSEPHALCIRLHLDQCGHCRSRVDTLNSLGAVMMEQQPDVSVSDTSFEQLFARIEEVPNALPAHLDPVPGAHMVTHLYSPITTRNCYQTQKQPVAVPS